MNSLLAIAAALLVTPLADGADRSRLGLAVSPARIAVTGHASRRIVLRNVGLDRVVVDVRRRAIGWRTAARKWLEVTPANAVLRPGARVGFTMRVRPPRRAEPGDHPVLVMLTTRPSRDGRVAVRMRVGVRVRLHVPGRVVRRVTLRGMHVKRRGRARVLFVSVTNRGNVTIPLRGRLTVSLARRGRPIARLRPRTRRALRPRERATLALRYRGRVRGLVAAVVRLHLGGDTVERRFHVRL